VPGTAGTADLVHGGHDPAVVLAEGADLSHLPRGIVGEAKLHKLALQGRGLVSAQHSPGDQEGDTGVGSVPSVLWVPWCLTFLVVSR
jgi:hypothetical protein